MYYRLVSVNSCRLPAQASLRSDRYHVASGGLLLERPDLTPHGNGTLGHSVLTLSGSSSLNGPSAQIMSMAYDYRPGQDGAIAVGELVAGTRLAATGRYSAERASLELPPGIFDSELAIEFVAAPGDPITGQWRDAFLCEGLFLSARGPVRWYHHLLFAAIRAVYASTRPLRRRAARRRVVDAWCAAA